MDFCQDYLHHNVVSSHESPLPSPSLNVENDPGLPKLVLSHIELVIGRRLHVQVESMALGINRLSQHVSAQHRVAELAYLKVSGHESIGIQQQEEIIQPVHQQALPIARFPLSHPAVHRND